MPENFQDQKKDNTFTIGKLASWGFGALFLFAGIGSLTSSGKPEVGVIYLIMAALLLPPVRSLVHKKTNKIISPGVRAISVILLLAAAAANTDTSAKGSSNPVEKFDQQSEDVGSKNNKTNENTSLKARYAALELQCPEPQDDLYEVESDLYELALSPDHYYALIGEKVENLPEFQVEEHFRSIRGKAVVWSGWVEDVKEKTFGGYEARIDMDGPNDPVSVQEVYFPVDKETAYKLKKDRVICFVGTIKSVNTVFGKPQVRLENVEVRQIY
ncbi:MAG: hypothetical protein KDC18_02950 [Alphaproteobacteria bacterium]|nr:hypothetical protein [Alphaproteobacteria bacterium]